MTGPSKMLTFSAIALAMLVSSDVNAQCSGAGRGGGGQNAMATGSTTPLMILANTGNSLAFQSQLAYQQQQVLAMHQQMMAQQQQLIAMQQQRMQQIAQERYEQQQELHATRLARAEAKRAKQADRIAALKAKRLSESDDAMLALTKSNNSTATLVANYDKNPFE